MAFNPKDILNNFVNTDRSTTTFTNPSSVTRRSASYNAPVVKSGAKAVYAAMDQYKRRGKKTLLKFPQEEIKYFTLLEYSKYSRLGAQSSAGIVAPLLNVAFQTEGSIALPMPVQGLADQQNIEYTEFNIGGASQGLKAGLISTMVSGLGKGIDRAALMSGQADFSTAGQVASTAAANAGKILQEFPTSIGNSTLEALAGAGLSSSLGNLAQSLTGVVPNSFVTLLFKGPKYKNHTLAWKLIPSSFEESLLIRDIITKLNNIAAPGLSAGGFLYDFPYIVYPSFRPNADFMFKFKPCVITSVGVDFAPSKVPAFYTSPKNNDANPPEAVTITLQLTEIEFWLRNQFDDSYGYNPNQISNTHRDPGRAATPKVADTPTEQGPPPRLKGQLD